MFGNCVVLFCLLATVIHNTTALPITYPSLNSIYNQIPPDAIAGTPVITEIEPSLQFGDMSVTGELPVGGSIRVKGIFPVYGSVVVDGSLPSSGTAVVNTGCVNTQVI
ncbi:uncharacterized protein LOC113506647 [Trichoplusia ni]|uniref:Uncharacterized protein LOC113506647 n=1 Tax=Trichoplusia ni TaxID=7111 RepID=A0A7E5WWQ1_TRINI|nr:uncharacterized protein LOC113506647 [Trichoplusia ni]